MNEQRNLLIVVGEWLEQRKSSPQPVEQASGGRLRRFLRWLTPNGGTLLLIAALVLTQQVWAGPLLGTTNVPGPSATTVNYQGRLADDAGNPITQEGITLSFAIYDAESGGNLIWPLSGPESHVVDVSDGLFSVGLGSRTLGGIPTSVWNGDRYLEIAVGGETLEPRELIRSVPIAGMALTVPDGAIGSEQIADGAVTQEEAPSLIRDLAHDGTIIQYGVVNSAQSGDTVTFPQPFNNPPLVFITQREASGGFGRYLVYDVTSTEFVIYHDTSNIGHLQWLAIGQ